MSDNLPVNWQEQMAAMAVADAKAERVQSSTISLKSGVMSYMGAPIPNNTLDCIIIAAVFENRYYPERYDPDNVQVPLCWAMNIDGKNMAPDPELVTEAQSPACVGCQYFEWESDPVTGKGKACKSVRRLGLIPADSVDPAVAELAILTVSVTNTKYWSQYVNKVAASLSKPTFAVVTRIKVTPDPKTQFRIEFEPLGPVAEELLPDLMTRRAKVIEQLLEPYPKREPKEEKPTKKRKF